MWSSASVSNLFLSASVFVFLLTTMLNVHNDDDNNKLLSSRKIRRDECSIMGDNSFSLLNKAQHSTAQTNTLLIYLFQLPTKKGSRANFNSKLNCLLLLNLSFSRTSLGSQSLYSSRFVKPSNNNI